MSNRQYLVVSATLFSLVAIAHFLRLAFAMTVTVADYVVPMYVSWIGLLVPAVLAVSALRLLGKRAAAGQAG